jgi:hypothetical protein
MNKIEQMLNQYKPYYSGELKTAAWIGFWLFILTWGEPDLVGAVVAMLMNTSG